MEKMYFADESFLEIQEGASLNSIVIIVDNYSDLQDLENLIKKPGNLNPITFQTDEREIHSIYNHIVINNSLFSSIDKIDDKIYVTLSFREMTEDEIAVENISKDYEKNKEDIVLAITYLSDDEALTVPGLFPTFESLIGQTVNINTRFIYSGEMYKTIQEDLLIQEQYKPGEGTGALYIKISDDSHAGTKEDPIPIPSNIHVSGFEYEYGKYYKENEVLYLAKREGKENGEKEVLYFTPSEVIDQYFEKVTSDEK